MSYEMHITRADSYLEDDSPITLSEIVNSLGRLPKGFAVDRTGVVSATTPSGETITAAVGPYLIYEDSSVPGSRVHIYFRDDGPYFSVADDGSMLPIIELADAIGAKVQGDEEEIYTRENILKNSDG